MQHKITSTGDPSAGKLSLVSSRGYLVANLRAFSTIRELHRSRFFLESSGEIRALLQTPEVHPNPSARSRTRSFLRIAQWNIETGRNAREIAGFIENHGILRWSDVILINEADHGMARSRNLHVAREIGKQLGMHVAFCPAHIELTPGIGKDQAAGNQNGHSLQGNAVLSRHPITEAKVISLPVCFEPYEFHEKRYGTRNCLLAKLSVHGSSLWAGAVHLEVRNTPRCRAYQMRHLLARLPSRPEEPVVLGGDLNSNGFRRGSCWRTINSAWRLLSCPADVTREQLRHPERGAEPLFRIVSRHGFSWTGLNSDEATATAALEMLEDASMLPALLARWVQPRLLAFSGRLDFKLDWILGRNVRGLLRGELVDPLSGATSEDPGCVETERTGQVRLSDHSPIFADIRF
jgi:endonuclease/exonuclease/phosphatase family metal-dependent hydrolase